MLPTQSTRLNKYISESGICSRREADRYIEQGNVFLNGKRATIGDQVKAGDVVAVREKSKNQLRIAQALELCAQRGRVEWVEVDAEKKSGVFKNVPARSDLSADINESLIVELYSK